MKLPPAYGAGAQRGPPSKTVRARIVACIVLAEPDPGDDHEVPFHFAIRGAPYGAKRTKRAAIIGARRC